MASIKKYEIRGAMEYSLPVKFGQRFIRVTFTGGCINSQRVEPASAFISNPVLQSLIEESKEFRQGTIKLAQVIKTEEKAEETETEAEDVYSDITNLQAARTILTSKYDLDLAVLQTKKQILEAADKVGAKFPNIK